MSELLSNGTKEVLGEFIVQIARLALLADGAQD